MCGGLSSLVTEPQGTDSAGACNPGGCCRRKVTAVHKANIMKKTDGLFLECCREVRTLEVWQHRCPLPPIEDGDLGRWPSHSTGSNAHVDVHQNPPIG